MPTILVGKRLATDAGCFLWEMPPKYDVPKPYMGFIVNRKGQP